VETNKVIENFDISKEKVILIPQGTTKESILDKSYWIVTMQRKMTLFFPLVYMYCYGATREENNSFAFLRLKNNKAKK
jgi:hypothetical protein